EKIVFLFPGGGAQYPGMGRDLYAHLPVFRKHLDRCFFILSKYHGLDIRRFILGEKDDPAAGAELEKPSNALPALFSVEYALAKMWMDLGIRPAEMIGHSMGEYTAACLAGVMSLKDALALVSVRGKLFEKLPPGGCMLSVPMPPEAVRGFMDNGLSVAVINKPDACVVAGSKQSVERLREKLEKAGIEGRKIMISVAAHSKQVEPVLDSFGGFLQNIELRPPTCPYLSNVTGTYITDAEATDPEYWVRHLRQTVLFSDGLEAIFQKPGKILLEVGPGQTLSTFARTHPAKNKNQLILATLRHPKEPINDFVFWQKTIARLWVDGLNPDWSALFKNLDVRRISLPGYP
ncbi:MAG: acyltransferase domain-containing protein, partial [Bacteroidetes bacterium]